MNAKARAWFNPRVFLFGLIGNDRQEIRGLEMEINALRSELSAARMRADALQGVLESIDIDRLNEELFTLRLENASYREIFLRQGKQ